MKVAIGLPTGVPGTPGPRLVEWARAAEGAGFSSLGTIGRIVFDSHEELIALAAAAGATRRIRLATTVMVSPLRETTLLAKQAATLDALSGGRLMLGLGAGAREDDYLATGASFRGRGAAFDRQLETLRRLWRGDALSAEVGPVGPKPTRTGGPEILLGGTAPTALARAGRLADGYLAMPLPPDPVRQAYEAVRETAKEAGRARPPRLLGAAYYVLGEAEAEGEANMAAYYAFGGAGLVTAAQGFMLRSEAAIRERIEGLSAIGVDEVFFWPAVARLEQVELLAKVAL